MGKDKMNEYKNGMRTEYLNNDGETKIFEGEHLHGQRHGKGKEFFYNGKIKFEGEYKNGKMWKGFINIFSSYSFSIISNGEGNINEYDYYGNLIYEGYYSKGMRNGKGTEYYICDSKKIKFIGKYLDDKMWNGIGYNYDGEEEFNIKDGEGKVKEYNDKNELIFEGEYKKGIRNGKGKEYFGNGEIKFEGEYKDGLRNGKGKEYCDNEILLFEGEYINGLRHGSGKEYHKNHKIFFEGEYLNGKREGVGQEFDTNGSSLFKGEYSNGKRWNGKGREYNGYLLEFQGLYQKGKRWSGTLYEYDWETGEITYEGKILEGIKIEE